MKVLIVDDNKDLADIIQNVLEGEGLEAMTACDGIDGYAAYLRFNPDLVITDIQMPGGTGLEMMQHIRTHNPLIKTVYMSGDVEAHRSALEQERKRYPVTILRKPFPLAALLALAAEPATDLPGEDEAVLDHDPLQESLDGIPRPH